MQNRLSPSASRVTLRESKCLAARSSFRLWVPALELRGRPGRGHPTPRAPALCPAPPRAALPRVREGAPAAPALTRAEMPARARVRCAAQTGVGAGRARAAPMPDPRRDRVLAGGEAAPAASGSAPRASRGPPAPPPSSGRPRARLPLPPRTRLAPLPLAVRIRPEEGRSAPRRWALAARSHSPVPASRLQPVSACSRGGPALPKSHAPSPFQHRAPRGRGAASWARLGVRCGLTKSRFPQVRQNWGRRPHLVHGEPRALSCKRLESF